MWNMHKRKRRGNLVRVKHISNSRPIFSPLTSTARRKAHLPFTVHSCSLVNFKWYRITYTQVTRGGKRTKQFLFHTFCSTLFVLIFVLHFVPQIFVLHFLSAGTFLHLHLSGGSHYFLFCIFVPQFLFCILVHRDLFCTYICLESHHHLWIFCPNFYSPLFVPHFCSAVTFFHLHLSGGSLPLFVLQMLKFCTLCSTIFVQNCFPQQPFCIGGGGTPNHLATIFVMLTFILNTEHIVSSQYQVSPPPATTILFWHFFCRATEFKQAKFVYYHTFCSKNIF